MKKKYIVKLKAKEKRHLQQLLKKGKSSARKLNRCRILLLAHQGKTDELICNILSLCPMTPSNIRRRYYQEGCESSLAEKPRSGAPKKFEGKIKAKITALACSKPPEGRSRWTLRLLADRIIELQLSDSITHMSVDRILKKTNLSLT